MTANENMQDRGHLMTELRNPRSLDIDRASIADAFDILNDEDAIISAAVRQAKDDICAAIELVVHAFEAGGRLIYVGAGTSGRLGVLDASECPPTFLSDPKMVQGVIAGGWDALRMAIEGAEDHPEDGAQAIDEKDVGPNDVVFGITTGGTTPYVHGAIARAKERGAKTVFFACVKAEHVAPAADVSIRVLVGPEVVTGSTRMKAGTATKLVLNMITTIAMIRIGKVYENLMVDVNTRANKKLVDRGTRMIQTITGLERDAAHKLLDESGGHVKTAIVMHCRKVDRGTAEALLGDHHGRLAEVVPHEAKKTTEARRHGEEKSKEEHTGASRPSETHLKARELSEQIIGAAIEVHRHLGPGLLESAYEECMAYELKERGLAIARQVPLPIEYKGQSLSLGYRLDLVVNDQVVVELKSVHSLTEVHEAQLLSYLKLSGMKVGLLINFNVDLIKNGIRRRVL